MALPQHDEIVALGRAPIAGDSPVGDPCRYETSFEELQGQLDRIGSLTGEEVEWGVVVDLATELLRTKSKDLLVITYLTLGLFEHRGYQGLAAGLEAYGEFLKNFWEGCYPKVKPPHGRYNAVQYLADRILPLVELKAGQCRKEPGADDKEAVHKCAELTEQLDKTVADLFAPLGETPNLMLLVRAMRALRDKVGPLGGPPPAEQPAAPAAAGAAPGAASAAAPAAAPVAMPESFATPAQATESVLKVAKYLFNQNKQDARAFRLARAVHFGGLAAAPKDGLLPGPPPQRRQFLEKLATEGNWAELVSQGEGQFIISPLWLDLQRYIGTALKNLGPACAAAQQAVALEVAALRARLPELFDLTFRDHTPFADGATKAWVAELAAEFGGGSGGGGGGGGGDALSAAVADARKLMSEAKSAEAVARLSQAADTAAAGRDRLRAQVALARLLMDMNRLTLAMPLLEQLERQSEEASLERWEPELAGEIWQYLFDCLRRLKPKPTPEDLQRQSQVFGRLARVNPCAALKLDTAAKS
ncbi:MAG: type VI secretion system protein TssA [Phycisphaerae bacterium]|jgi:type VI secretion system protein VasJ